MTTLIFSSYGSRIGVRTNIPDLLEKLKIFLLPQTESIQEGATDEQFSLFFYDTNHIGGYFFYQGNDFLAKAPDLKKALELLVSALHKAIALYASPFLFVHAGVVGWDGKAIVIPGRSMSGKTSLVAALVKAGAEYYSDEYAVFDENGYIHPYPKPLSIRSSCGMRAKKCEASEFGGKNGKYPISPKLIVDTHFKENTIWKPYLLSPGKAVLRLLDNTICATTRTKQAISIFSNVANQSTAISGFRPTGEQVVSSIIEFCNNDNMQ
jgi:hypothetical protein